MGLRPQVVHPRLMDFLYIFLVLRKNSQINIGRNSLERPFEMTVGFLPPFEEAVGTNRRGKRR
jgi:hypothetical protein